MASRNGAVSEAAGRPVAILGDLQGPRIRIGALPAPRELEVGSTVVLVPEEVASGDEIPITYADLCHDVNTGNRVLINDGLFELVVTRVEEPRVWCTVVHGGKLTSNKGMNLPGIAVSAPIVLSVPTMSLSIEPTAPAMMSCLWACA